MSLSIATAADQGPRDSYEDAWAWLALQIRPALRETIDVLAFADGAGGYKAGEIASQTTVRTIPVNLVATLIDRAMAAVDPADSHLDDDSASGDRSHQSVSLSAESVLGLMADTCNLANQVILRRASLEPTLEGMATTIVIVVVFGGVAHLAWAGDSRCYLYRRGHLRQLTRDHSELQRLVDAGVIDSGPINGHPLGHIIYRCLGRTDGAQVQTHICPMLPGDKLLLCSDGLTDVVTDEELAQILGTQTSLELTAQRLVARALDAGTTDNTTVVCATYEPTHSRPQHPTTTLTIGYNAELASILSHL